jgi:GT2 family glycosyltransferase
MEYPVTQYAADIIVPVHNQYPHTRTLLESIYRYTDLPFRIYLIDNASTDETTDIHKIYTRDITIVRNRENLGWCGGINQGIDMGSNPYVVFTNNSVEVSQGWLGNLLAFLETHPRIGAVGPLNSNPNDWQCVDRVREKMVAQIPFFLTEDLHERNRILNYHFHGAGILIEGELAFFCTALKRRAVAEVGLLETFFQGGRDDSGYCRRLRKAGYVLGLSLDTYVLHNSCTVHAPAYHASVNRESRRRNVSQPRNP